MSDAPCILAEVVFRSRAECGRWYPPRPPWDSVPYLVTACVEGTTSPLLVRIIDGPRVAAGEPGRFVLAPQAVTSAGDLLGDPSAFQPGVRFFLIDARFSGRVGTGVVLERLRRTAPPLDEPEPPDDGPPWKRSGPPTRLSIRRDEGRFVNVGRLADGTQFLAYVCGAFPDGCRFSEDDWRTKKRWQAVVHRFDAGGHHTHTEVRLGGVEADGDAGARAFRHLNAMYDDLAAGGEPEFGDIWVELFSREVDGITYGLFYEQSEEEPDEYEGRGEWVMLEPWDIMFHPPWDSGYYST
jgi:formate hydrogenlyase regulatory protein HycA